MLCYPLPVLVLLARVAALVMKNSSFQPAHLDYSQWMDALFRNTPRLPCTVRCLDQATYSTGDSLLSTQPSADIKIMGVHAP